MSGSSIDFRGLPYHSLNVYFQNLFGERVYRVSIDAGFCCPNRDGSKSTGGCVFCNESGARARYVNPAISITSQLQEGIALIEKRYGAKKFIAYFQSYSNTYEKTAVLEKIYREVLGHPQVVGISIGTRPDCIDREKLALIDELAKEKWVMVEYGAQTMHDKTLSLLNRHHTVGDTIQAIQMTKLFPRIKVLSHLIFGLPNETLSEMTLSVSQLVKLGVDAFKFHHLFIERNTAYAKSMPAVLSLEEYASILCQVIPLLPVDTVIHRLVGQSNQSELIAPLWTLSKSHALHFIEETMRKQGIIQGMDYKHQ